MSTRTSPTPPEETTAAATGGLPDTTAARLFKATAIVGVIGAAAYVSSLFVVPLEGPNSGFAHPYAITVNWICALSLIALAVQLPRAWSDPRLPRWAVGVLAAGTAFTGAIAFTFATTTARMYRVFDAEALAGFDSGSLIDSVGWPKMALVGVGAITLAIVGWRRGVFGKAGLIGLLLAGLLSGAIWPFPPGALALCLTLALLGARNRQAKG